jgi:hypothetical protein
MCGENRLGLPVAVYNPVDGVRMKCGDGERRDPVYCPRAAFYGYVTVTADLPEVPCYGDGQPVELAKPEPRRKPGPPPRAETASERARRWRREGR